MDPYNTKGKEKRIKKKVKNQVPCLKQSSDMASSYNIMHNEWIRGHGNLDPTWISMDMWTQKHMELVWIKQMN